MLLNDTEIKRRNLVRGAVDKQFRDTGYDLTVGMILNTAGTDCGNEFVIQGGGIVEVISQEAVVLPFDVTAFAHVKTALVSRGLFPLNIGIIDPGWNAKISATLLNFGDDKPKLI